MTGPNGDPAPDALDDLGAGPSFQFVPMSPEDAAVIRIESVEEAKRQQKAFPVLVAQLQALFRSVYPPHVLAVIAGWGLRTAVSDDGFSSRPMIPGVEQHHVEMLQAMALTLPWAEWGQDPAEPEQIQQAIDTIIALGKAFQGRRYAAFAALTGDVEQALAALQDRVRTHTQMVRNWGYYGEVTRISRALYGPLDQQLEHHHGFTANQVINVLEALVQVIESQVDDRFRLLKDIFRASTISELVRSFFERYPGVAGDPHAFLDSLDPAEPIESVRGRLHIHADRWLVKCSVAPLGAVAERAGVTTDITARVLDRVCLRPGALTDRDVEHLFMANPVWAQPGVKTGADYFFATPQTVFSFVHDVFKPLFMEAGLEDALARRRSAYLEQEAARVVTHALPGARVATGKGWAWQGVAYETDVLAVLDHTVIIAEAKSARLTPEGLRGSPQRVGRHITELVVEPSRQSQRLEEILWRAKSGDRAATEVTRTLGLDTSVVDTVVRITVTLDDFSILCAAEGVLRDADLVPRDIDLAPTLNIADFGCVADLLSPAQFIHYFAERGRLQRRVNVVGDELDLLGLYLQTGFNLNGLPEVQNLAIYGMSAAVDGYYTGRDAGFSVSKPHARQGALVRRLLGPLEARRPKGWTTMALDVLRAASFEEQEGLVQTLEVLRAGLLGAPGAVDPQNSVVWTPPHAEDAVLVICLFRQADQAGRKNAILGLVDKALSLSGRSRCTFVGHMVEDWDAPWQLIGCAYGADEVSATPRR